MKYLVILFLSTACLAQPQSFNNPILFPGVPSGSCSGNQTAINKATGEFYTCLNNTWTTVVGGASAFPSLTSLPNINASSYGVIGEGHFASTATWTSGSPVVTCAACHFNTNAVTGQLVYGSNGVIAELPQGTILSVDSDTQITVSVNATGTTSSNNFLVWGTDESTQLNNAWTATKNACSTLVLPGVNPEGTGPAVILVQSSQLVQSSAATPCPGDNTSHARTGLTIYGQGVNSTYIVPTANFDPTTCLSGALANACFLATKDGLNIHDFSIWGAKIAQPGSGFGSKVGAEIHSLNNASGHNVEFLFWGSSTSNGLGVGFQMAGGQIVLSGIHEDGFGQVGCKTVGTSSAGPVQFVEGVCFDNASISLYLTNATSRFTSVASSYGGSAQLVSVNNGATGQFIGDRIGGVLSAANVFLVGYSTTVSGTVTGAGTAYIQDSFVGDNTVSAGGHVLFLNSSTDTLYIGASLVKDTSSQTLITNNGFLYDLGGNTYSEAGGTLYAGTGIVYGSNSITGTACVTGNLVLTSGWDTSTKGTITGDSQSCQFTITAAGTPGASPVLTYTFPTPFLVAPRCILTEVGGTFGIITNPAHVVTATTDTITFSGTAVATQTYTFVEQCQ